MAGFPGHIGRTVQDSTPWWPTPPLRHELPPNIITILFDDTGWSDFGCYGSEIKTPNIDALASDGLRYNNFHVTPLCSPSRASLMTGRNHHNVGMRSLADTDTGFPSGRGRINPDVPMLPKLLQNQGYATYMVGKWHLTPSHEITPAGPYRTWPVQSGFDKYYGFLGGCTDQLVPEIYQDNQSFIPKLGEDYHLSEDLTDRAISNLREHASFRSTAPFFLNLWFGATHAPFQVDKSYIDPYVPVFEKGWDQTREDRLAQQKSSGLVPKNTELTPRNDDIPAWDSLSDDEKRLFTRLQACFAGFLEHTDVQIGRLIAELKRLDMFDNTVILILSDNGASREGGPTAPSTQIQIILDNLKLWPRCCQGLMISAVPKGQPSIRRVGRWQGILRFAGINNMSNLVACGLHLLFTGHAVSAKMKKPDSNSCTRSISRQP